MLCGNQGHGQKFPYSRVPPESKGAGIQEFRPSAYASSRTHIGDLGAPDMTRANGYPRAIPARNNSPPVRLTFFRVPMLSRPLTSIGSGYGNTTRPAQKAEK
jgi:hypothetical protein